MVNDTYISSAIHAGIINTNALYLFLIILMPICFCIFIYFMAIILNVYFTTAHVQEEARYILFIHMLINDAVYLILGLFLFFETAYLLYLPVPICYILVTVSSSSFKVTPYNLAVMCLERYIAICFPLRHAVFCTRQNSLLAIAVIWIIGLIPNVADFIILCFYVRNSFFSFYSLCMRSVFVISVAQNTIRSLVHALTFSLVGLMIVFTYIKIMLVALKVDSGKASASRAGKTVILHAFQLLLCMTAFTYTLTEAYLTKYLSLLPVINFFFFMCLPRFISPLIYGLRDEAFSKYLKRFVICKPLRTYPNSETAQNS